MALPPANQHRPKLDDTSIQRVAKLLIYASLQEREFVEPEVVRMAEEPVENAALLERWSAKLRLLIKKAHFNSRVGWVYGNDIWGMALYSWWTLQKIEEKKDESEMFWAVWNNLSPLQRRLLSKHKELIP